jgi:uroporphyrin-III C-methyltransferase / precorrin-2 dehydrogenase / sirohydrochlorin ferrochelatase
MHLPLFFNSDGIHCLVIGGGEVASHKIDILCRYNCRTTVIAPDVIPSVSSHVDNGAITWQKRKYESGDCSNYSLVIAATGQRGVNKAVSDEAKSLSIPVNVVDDPELCTVTFAAIHRDEDLTLAVSTGGSAPFMAAEIRNRISDHTTGWGNWLNIAGRYRAIVRKEVPDFEKQKSLYQSFVDIKPFPIGAVPPDEESLEKWMTWLNSVAEENIR